MINLKPSFWDFYKGCFSKKNIYRNIKTGKLYVEKNANRNSMVFLRIILASPMLTLLIYWITLTKDKFIEFFVFIIILDPSILFIILLIAYPMRYFFVAFEEVGNEIITDKKQRWGEFVMFIGYTAFSLLVKFIVVERLIQLI